MIPSCLRVERAIIFFRSDSTTAESPAISMVKAERRRRIGRKGVWRERNG